MPDGPASTQPSETDELELGRWGTKFSKADAERRYRVWRADQSVTFNRAGLLASVVVWSALIVLFLTLGVFRIWAFVILLAALPVVGTAILTTYRGALRRWMMPATMLANMVAGFIVVGLANARGVALEATFGAIFIANYFGFAIFRMPPSVAALAVAPYMACEAVVRAFDLHRGLIDTPSFAGDVFGLTTAFFTGLTINVVFDINARRGYRQERIIESQKETIARERERTEALLKSELSHQVAERSRELGDVLARIASPSGRSLPTAAGDLFHDRYRIVRPLGVGGMGAVFEVERVTDGQRLALKIMTGTVSGVIAARFAREAEIGARVRHPNLISIVDVGIAEGGAPFLAMELVAGGALDGRRERFGETPWAIPILQQIALGLSALHAAGVVHRDLKPGNVLLSDAAAPVAKISDYGISRLGWIDDGEDVDPRAATIGATPTTPDLTGTGVLIGTPAYMAPEAARGGRTLGAAADMFAFGILAYEMLTGRLPFERPAVLMALADQEIEKPASIDGVRVAGQAILACLAVDPKARPTAREVHDALLNS